MAFSFKTLSYCILSRLVSCVHNYHMHWKTKNFVWLTLLQYSFFLLWFRTKPSISLRHPCRRWLHEKKGREGCWNSKVKYSKTWNHKTIYSILWKQPGDRDGGGVRGWDGDRDRGANCGGGGGIGRSNSDIKTSS